MIYIAYYFLTFIISIFFLQRQLALLVILLTTFVFIGFSFPAGGDWIGYFNNYDCIINNRCNFGFIQFESGYEFIVQIIGNWGFQSILIFLAAINIFLINKYAKNFENSALIVFFLMCTFLWSMYIEVIRQALAFSLILYAVLLLYNHSIKKIIFVVLLASLFHITALVCLILPLFSIRLSKIVSYSMLVSSIFFIFIYFIFQIIRPFTYDYSNLGIMQQEMIIQKMDSLDDSSLRLEARKMFSFDTLRLWVFV